MEEEPRGIVSLVQSLNHRNKKVVRQASDSLIAMAPQLPQLGERLDRLLSETPRENRWPIAYVLAHLSSPSPLCLSVLLETLDSNDPDLRWAAAQLFVRLGKGDGEIANLLLKVLKTGTPIQRRMALYCLRDLQLRDAASLKALLEALRDTDSLVRVAAVTSLKSRPDVGKDGVDALLRLFLEDRDSRVRHIAAIALGQIAAPGDEVRAALKEAGLSENSQLKKAAKAALALLEKKGPVQIALGRPPVD